MRLKFKLPFPIVLEDKNEATLPPFDGQPISEPQMGCPVSGVLRVGQLSTSLMERRAVGGSPHLRHHCTAPRSAGLTSP